jgi:hypothetical protein
LPFSFFGDSQIQVALGVIPSLLTSICCFAY